ncbi:hypothetical protein FGM00_17420 [Aggregatimonas sangjinii]|uniref:Uncharacterized protein n=1 Tax=Aggregatimonas sangjinii TaxID=2583587 RepID=A0A5B7SX02_9FLAO|nr:TonB-dependent receptor [Aggregatimonas sangjinii]QCX01809.1 hypothetical protein FGM00_17420 [Aggregatimonas sangjinii]
MNYLRQLSVFILLLIAWPAAMSGAIEVVHNSGIHSGYFQAAPQELKGKVTDATTGETIPYCNIKVASSTMGTATNELGEFILEVDSFPATLTFSHVNYETYRVKVSNNSDLNISLIPLTTVLDEVVVSASERDVLALNLAKKAFLKAENDAENDLYGRAFYRQKSKNGENYSEFSEIFYDIRYGSAGIKNWSIVEGRYALNENAVINRNYTSFSRLLTPLQPKTDKLVFPLHPDFERHYTVNVREIIQSDDAKIAIVHFSALPSTTIPAFSGDVYIDMNSYDIRKVTGVLKNDAFDMAKLTTKNASWKNYEIAYDINYKIDSTKQSVLDYIKVDQSFDYYKNDSLQYRTSTSSNLLFYEHYRSNTRKKLGGRLRNNRSDWKKLDAIGYNEQFWLDNPIVKRTPVEEEVINAFEKKEAFNSVFLNSSDNLALMDLNIAQDPFIIALTQDINDFRNYNPVEKVFLHTDKELLAEGEDLWFSAYVVLGSNHEYSGASSVFHVDLIGPDSKIVIAQTHPLRDGRGSGNLQLPKNLPSGRYQLRSYTQWMRNFNPDFFFKKEIEIINENDSQPSQTVAEGPIDLQFFPEGGHLVADLQAKVAFKAVGSDGLNVKIKGNIIDSSGKQVALLSTLDRGGGFFSLRPEKGETYTAVLEDGTRYELPAALENGYGLLADNLNPNTVRLTIQASEALRNNSFYLVAHSRQRQYYQGKFEFGNEKALRLEIPKTRIPGGVLTITLFDSDGKPWCERAIFITSQQELDIETNTEKLLLETREKVTFQVTITDTNGQPVATEFSVAITDKGQAARDTGSGTILTQLLLESNIKGHVENPGLLFSDQERGTLRALDLVMLTHGWRKYNWLALSKTSNDEKKYPFAKGLPISGTAKKPSGAPLKNTVLRVIAKADDRLGVLSTQTEVDGTFELTDFNLEGETTLVFNAFDSADKPIDLNVTLNEFTNELPSAEFSSSTVRTDTEEIRDYQTYATTRKKSDSIFNFENVTKLENVTVVDKKKEKRADSPSLYGVVPDLTVYADDQRPLVDIFQLLRGVPGLRVSGTGFDSEISIRNGGSPLWIVDGVPFFADAFNPNQSFNGESNGGTGTAPPPGFTEGRGGVENVAGTGSATRTPSAPVPDLIKTLDVLSIDRIEVHKAGTASMISGLRGQNGVIIVYTKSGAQPAIDKVEAPTLKVQGHSMTKEFYSPKYDVPLDVHKTPDYRATLYWNPKMSTDANGKATIEFYNSDLAKEIQVSIEALSPDGIAGAVLKSFGGQ